MVFRGDAAHVRFLCAGNLWALGTKHPRSQAASFAPPADGPLASIAPRFHDRPPLRVGRLDWIRESLDGSPRRDRCRIPYDSVAGFNRPDGAWTEEGPCLP